jgi:CelD/BcsL family acetyltransferase involved in cellulose biosynthesis
VAEGVHRPATAQTVKEHIGFLRVVRPLAEVRPLRRLAEIRDEWLALEAGAEKTPYLSFGWLQTWEAVYRPHRLGVLRVRAGSEVIGMGLLSLANDRRLQFAGRPVTPDCRLLCVPEMEAAAWKAVAKMLRMGQWERLEGRGISREAAGALPRGSVSPLSWLALTLPESFDVYLRQRSPGARKGLKGKLRRAAREGTRARTVADSERGAALRDFVRLHQQRARSKGQHHPAVDELLVRMLGTLAEPYRPRMFELVAGDDRIGVALNLEASDTTYFYNAGFDPEWSHVSPGIILQLASLRDAIERGLRRYDLGPGDFRYKHDLGGVDVGRYLFAIAPRRVRLRRPLIRLRDRPRKP